MEYTDLDGKVFVQPGNRTSLEAPYKQIFEENRNTKSCLYQIRNYMINRDNIVESGVELKSVRRGALPKFDGADLSYDQGFRIYRRLEFKTSSTSKLVAVFLLKDAIEEFVADWQRQHPTR
jgi:hypothetical protein